jgi:hypothetical protein
MEPVNEQDYTMGRLDVRAETIAPNRPEPARGALKKLNTKGSVCLLRSRPLWVRPLLAARGDGHGMRCRRADADPRQDGRPSKDRSPRRGEARAVASQPRPHSGVGSRRKGGSSKRCEISFERVTQRSETNFAIGSGIRVPAHTLPGFAGDSGSPSHGQGDNRARHF